MLRKMRGAQRRANIFKFLYWLVIIGIAAGAFYFLQPYFQVVQDLYQQVQTTRSGITASPQPTAIIISAG